MLCTLTLYMMDKLEQRGLGIKHIYHFLFLNYYQALSKKMAPDQHVDSAEWNCADGTRLRTFETKGDRLQTFFNLPVLNASLQILHNEINGLCLRLRKKRSFPQRTSKTNGGPDPPT